MQGATAATVGRTTKRSQDFEGLPDKIQLNYTRGFDNITPLCLLLVGNLEHRVISTLDEFEDFKGRFPDMREYLDDVLEDLKSYEVVSIEGCLLYTSPSPRDS